MTKTRLLFITILIEGYVVLACELLAMRLLIPFVGSGVEIMAIVISGVLLPLAVGYHAGGMSYKRAFLRARRNNSEHLSIRRILLRNILVALLILALGLSYQFLDHYFSWLAAHGVRHRLWQTALYAAIFLVLPVFLLGQTVPLISNYFSRHRLSEITGRMLFFSTAGSFLGSIFSTLVLMTGIGVHNTVIVTLGLLFLLCVLLGGRRRPRATLLGGLIMAGVIALNNGYSMRQHHVVSDNAYNIARVVPTPSHDGTLLMLNRSPSSLISSDPHRRFAYVRYIESNFIDTMDPGGAPREIMVIGAGGFTIGLADTHNHYTFIDIDPDLKRVSEDEFLHQKLPPNKRFVAASARAFVVQDRHKYDLIVIDVTQQKYSIPMECMTREFLQAVGARLGQNGVLIVNMLSAPDFSDLFSVRYDRTFSAVFPVHSRQIMDDPPFNPWTAAGQDDPEQRLRNNLYIYFNRPLTQDETIYSDDRNTYSLDRP